MKRTFKDYFTIGLKGMAMGAADVVPGVSGGTIAFISGIYEELLSSISSINLKLLKTLQEEGFKAVWKEVNGPFLLSLFIGIFISVLSLAKIIKWLLENQPILLWSFFFGLVLASVIYVGKQILKWTPIVVISLIVGASLAYYITTLNPLISESASPAFLFLAGSIAICAMILPGISGAFILVLLGAYQPILTAINERDLGLIAIVGAGAVLGLLLFSKVLKWLFMHFKDLTLAILTGFIIGSLNKIWPWKKTLSTRLNSKGVEVPFLEESILPSSFDGDAQLLLAILMAIIGFLLILLLEKLATK